MLRSQGILRRNGLRVMLLAAFFIAIGANGCIPVEKARTDASRSPRAYEIPPPILVVTDHAGQTSIFMQKEITWQSIDERERPWVNWDLLSTAVSEAIGRVEPQQPRRIKLTGFHPTSRYPHEPPREKRKTDPIKPFLEQWAEPDSPLPDGRRWVWLQWHTLQWDPEEQARKWFEERRQRWPERAPIHLGGTLYHATDFILVQDSQTGNGYILVKPEGEDDLLQFSYKGAPPEPLHEWIMERAGGYARKEIFPPAFAYAGDWDDKREDPGTAWDLLSRAIAEAMRHVEQREPRQLSLTIDEFLAYRKEPRIDENRPIIPQLLEEHPLPFPEGWPAPIMTWKKPSFSSVPPSPHDPESQRQYEERLRRYAPWFKHEAIPIYLDGKWYRITDLIFIQAPYSGEGVILIQPENANHLLRFPFSGASPNFFTAWFLLNHDYYGRAVRPGG